MSLSENDELIPIGKDDVNLIKFIDVDSKNIIVYCYNSRFYDTFQDDDDENLFYVFKSKPYITIKELIENLYVN